MSECRVNFTREGHPLAYQAYEELVSRGVPCEEMDAGYAVYPGAGETCSGAEDHFCLKNEPGVIEPGEVLEYVFKHDRDYEKLLMKMTGEVLPWSLDDFDPDTYFDLETRARIETAIDQLTYDLEMQGFSEGSDEYYDGLVTGLYYLAAYPSAEAAKFAMEFSGTVEQRIVDFLELKELRELGLGEYADYLKTTGGFRLEGDLSQEMGAIEAIKNGTGECTENANVLFAIFRMACLEPQFIWIEGRLFDSGDPETNQRYRALNQNQNHVAVAVKINGKIRLVDSAYLFSHVEYKAYEILTLRQYFAQLRINHSYAAHEGFYYEKALQELRSAFLFDEKARGGYMQAARIYRDLGDHERALTMLSREMQISPEDPDPYLLRGVVFHSLGLLEKAGEDYLKAIEMQPENAAYLANFGKVLFQRGDYEEAIKYFSKAAALEPENAVHWLDLGAAYLGQGEYDQALRDLNKALEINPKEPLGYLNRGMLYYHLKKWDQAIEECNRAEGLNPEISLLYAYRGMAWIEKGELDRAIQDFSTLIRLSPDDDRAYEKRAFCWQEKNEMKKAANDYNAGAEICLKKKEYQRAILLLSKAIETAPGYYEPYHNRALVWLKLDKRDKAVADLQRALHINPHAQQSRELLNKIR